MRIVGWHDCAHAMGEYSLHTWASILCLRAGLSRCWHCWLLSLVAVSEFTMLIVFFV